MVSYGILRNKITGPSITTLAPFALAFEYLFFRQLLNPSGLNKICNSTVICLKVYLISLKQISLNLDSFVFYGLGMYIYYKNDTKMIQRHKKEGQTFLSNPLIINKSG